MSREILLLVDALAREKAVEKEVVFTALELALASATKRRFQEDIETHVSIDRLTGSHQSFRRWLVVDCLLYTSPSPRDRTRSRMPSSA